MEEINKLQATKLNGWLDFGIYPPKSETYAEFMCINPSLYKYNNVVIYGKYVDNCLFDEGGLIYRMAGSKYLKDGFIPVEDILAWRIG